MKCKYLWLAVIGLSTLLPLACNDASSMGPPYTGGLGGGGNPYATPTPRPTATPGGTPMPVTIMVSTGTSGASATGYIYISGSGSNGTGGLLSLSAHVGDAIVLPGSSIHPLYFDQGTTSCIYMAATSQQTYVFPSTGTYYFHCGNHGSGCSMGNAACGSTNCTSMAGQVMVN